VLSALTRITRAIAMHLQLQSIALTFTSAEAGTIKWVE